MDNPDQKKQIQLQLASLIAKGLQLPIDKIDFDQPLIDVGADSLVLSSTMAFINEEFGVKINMVQLFEELSTLSLIVDYIAEQMELSDCVAS